MPFFMQQYTYELPSEAHLDLNEQRQPWSAPSELIEEDGIFRWSRVGSEAENA